MIKNKTKQNSAACKQMNLYLLQQTKLRTKRDQVRTAETTTFLKCSCKGKNVLYCLSAWNPTTRYDAEWNPNSNMWKSI